MKQTVFTAVKVTAVAFMFTMASCDSPVFEPIDDGGNGGGGGSKGAKTAILSEECNTGGTMVRVICGTSIYDGLWIRTDDGKLLRPCDQSFQTFAAIELKEGDRIKFGFHEIKGPSPCDNMVGCMAAQPEHTSVVIDCLTVN